MNILLYDIKDFINPRSSLVSAPRHIFNDSQWNCSRVVNVRRDEQQQSMKCLPPLIRSLANHIFATHSLEIDPAGVLSFPSAPKNQWRPALRR